MDIGGDFGLKADFWKSPESFLILDQRRPASEISLFKNFYNKSHQFSAHVWLASSGSSQSNELSTKLIGLSKKSILASAQAVNDLLVPSDDDIWGLGLPQFHVGGLAIGARAFLSNSPVRKYSSEKWGADSFLNFVKSEKITLTSLVPTQVFDLVQRAAKCPANLRAVVVGGGALSKDLYRQARLLGWPVLPSFGMTEMSSQIATADLQSLKEDQFPEYKVLYHIDYKVSVEGKLGVRGPSLMTGYWQQRFGQDVFEAAPKNDYFWTTDLVVETMPGYLKPLGREGDFVKILGEGVHLGQIEDKLSQLLGSDLMTSAALVALPDERRGMNLVLVTEKNKKLYEDGLDQWNQNCNPVERIGRIQEISNLPKTILGKIQRQLLFDLARGS